MSYNVTAYIVYLILTVFIIVFVGRLFYRNGRLFILFLFFRGKKVAKQKHNEHMTMQNLANSNK